MGCGQSKINLYPRRSKAGGKGHGSKKSAGGDSKDGDEDEPREGGSESPPSQSSPAAGGVGGTSTSGGGGAERRGGKARPPPAPPHALGHALSTEISASQLDFFKMLDEKIDKGQDYDSSSETEIQIEQARVASLLQSWDAASQSYIASTSSPPTPRGGKRMAKGERRGHSESSPSLGKSGGSPGKNRAGNWKLSPKTQPQQQQTVYIKPGLQKMDSTDDHQRSYSPQLLTQREIHQSYGISQDYPEPILRDASQITYNPTFQSHSPIHTAKSSSSAQAISQPYIAQIVTYPTVSYQSVSQKYIAPAPGYQPPANPQPSQPQPIQPSIQQPTPPVVQSPQVAPQPQRFPVRIQPQNTPSPVGQIHSPNIYYIAPAPIVQGPIVQGPIVQGPIVQGPIGEGLTPKQQTALHLQQYVAMKQAQQRMMAGQDYSLYGQDPMAYNRKMYDRVDDTNFALNFMTLGRQPSASQKSIIQSQMRAISPGLMQFQQSQVTSTQSPQTQQIPFQQMGQMAGGGGFVNTPGCTASLGRNASLLHYKDNMINDRFGLNAPQTNVAVGANQSAVQSATRQNLVQNFNIVTQKTIGQIVPINTNQDVVIYQNDNGTETVVGGVSRTSSNNSVIGTETSTFKSDSNNKLQDNSDASSTTSSVSITKSVSGSQKTHIGSTIVGRQVYYSQVVSSGTMPDQQKVANSNSFILNSVASQDVASVNKKSSVDATKASVVRTIVNQKSNSVDKNGGDYL